VKLKGSAKICIQCLKCGLKSPFIKVYLYDDDEDGFIEWQPTKEIPEGWAIEEDAPFYESGDPVDGYCPKHNREKK